MNIREQVIAKEKAFEVIHSCKTYDQCQSASRYLENYLAITEDVLGYNRLVTDLVEITEDIDIQLRLREDNHE